MRCVTSNGCPRRFLRWVIAYVFAIRTVLPLEEVVISMIRSSTVTTFRLNSKLNDRCFCNFMAAMFVSLRGSPTWRLHTKLSKFGWNTSPNNVRIKIRADLHLGEAVYLRNRKRVVCFYRVIETRVKVWENEKYCGGECFRGFFASF